MSSVSYVQLGQVAKLNPTLNSAASISAEELVDFLPMSGVEAGCSIATPNEVRQFSDVRQGYTSFSNGDVLLAKITPCFENGKIAQALLKHKYGFGSTEFHVLRADPERLNSRYLVHFLRRDKIRLDGERKMTGSAGQRRVPKHFLESLSILLPPLPEQIRIAAILDQADALRVKRRETLAQLDSLMQAIFIDMFGDPAHNPFSFPLLPISGLVSNGRSKLVYGDENIWNLNLDQIEPNTGRVLHKVRSAPDKLGTSTFAFETGTVLYSKLRPYLNKVVVADEDGVATTELVPLKCIETLTKPAFLAYSLRSKRFVDFATETVAGAKMPRMMMDAFWSYQLPLPPVSLQDSFAEKITLIEKRRGTQLQSATEFDNLFASLQHRAFRGEL